LTVTASSPAANVTFTLKSLATSSLLFSEKSKDFVVVPLESYTCCAVRRGIKIARIQTMIDLDFILVDFRLMFGVDLV